MTNDKEAPKLRRAVGGESLGSETARAQQRNEQTKELLGDELGEKLAQPLTRRDATIRLLRADLGLYPIPSSETSDGVIMGSDEFRAPHREPPTRNRRSRP